MLVVGSAERIIDSARSPARKLEEARNEHVELFVSEGMPHGFYFFTRHFREEEAYNAVERFLKKQLAMRG